MVSTYDALHDLPILESELGEPIQEYTLPVQNAYQELMRHNSNHVLNHIAANHSDKVKETIKLVPPGKIIKPYLRS